MNKQKPEWPQTWRNKKSKQKLRVMPWLECINPIVSGKAGKHDFKVGALIQIGYLLENEHGIWFGVGLKAKKEFVEVKK